MTHQSRRFISINSNRNNQAKVESTRTSFKLNSIEWKREQFVRYGFHGINGIKLSPIRKTIKKCP
jgi:hypothetical protein